MTDQVPTDPATQLQLQLQDIIVAAQAITIASSRGAFRPEEFTRIGGAYDRIVSFLQASGAITPPSTATTTDAQQGN